MSYNIINTSTGETTSFDGRGVSFMSDSFSSSAAGQTKTINLTTMANQYMDAKKVCRSTLYTKVNVKGDFTADYTGKIVAEDVVTKAETVVLDLATVSNVADVNQDILLDLHVAADHYLKLKGSTFVPGTVDNVKLVFDMTPINSAADDAADVQKQKDMYEFYGTSGPTALNQRLRIEISMDPAKGWLDAEELAIQEPGDPRYHWGFCPAEIILRGSDGSEVALGLGGSDSRRYLSNLETATYTKECYVAPNIAYTIDLTQAPLDSTAFPGDKFWHPIMNYDRVLVNAYRGDSVKPFVKDAGNGAYLPESNFDEIAYASHAGMSITTFKLNIPGGANWNGYARGSNLNGAELLAWLAGEMGLDAAAFTTDLAAWTIDTSSFGSVASAPIQVSGSLPDPLPDLSSKYKYYYDLPTASIDNIVVSSMSEMPALPSPDMPALLDGDFSIVDGHFDPVTRMATINVNSTMSSNIDIKLGLYAYGDRDVYIQHDLAGWRPLAPQRGRGYFYEDPVNPAYEIGYDGTDDMRMEASVGLKTPGYSGTFTTKQDYFRMPSPDGLSNVCAQFMFNFDSAAGAMVQPTIVLSPGTHQHVIDMSSTQETGVPLCLMLDGPLARPYTSTYIDGYSILGPEGVINEYMANNLFYFDDNSANTLVYNGVSIPNTPYTDLVNVEEFQNPFGIYAAIANPCAWMQQPEDTALYNSICSLSDTPTAIKHGWSTYQPTTIGQIEAEYDGNTYYMDHLVDYSKRGAIVSEPHLVSETSFLPYQPYMKPGSLYAHVTSFTNYNYSVVTFGSSKSNAQADVPQERIHVFRVPEKTNGTDNLKFTIAMTNMEPDSGSSWGHKNSKWTQAAAGYAALNRHFDHVDYLDAESTFDAATNSGVMVYHCPTATAATIPDGTYDAPNGTFSPVENTKGSWAVSAEAVTLPVNAANYVAKVSLSIISDYTTRTGADTEWSEDKLNAGILTQIFGVLGGKKGLKVSLPAGEDDGATRKVLNQMFDIEFYEADSAVAAAMVGTDPYAGVYDARLLNDIRLRGGSSTTAKILAVHDKASPEASRPFWNPNDEPMFKYKLEFNGITASSYSNPWTQWYKYAGQVTDDLERAGLVQLAFDRFNFDRVGVGLSPLMTCMATEANMQAALNTVAINNEEYNPG